MWYVYVLKSLNKEYEYVGSTNNLKRRLKEHNSGLTQSTKAYAPFEIEVYVAVKSEKKARELEKYFKTGSGRAVLNKRFL
ncbi:MAG: GIY-YIG nuclease family protein [Bacteroidota bacterium]